MPSQHILNLPAWSGNTFVPTLHDSVPVNLTGHKLPTPYVALVTGASRGIGRAIAIALAAAGATGLILTARTRHDLATTEQHCNAASPTPGSLKITLVEASVEQEASAVRLADAVKAEHAGRLDLLVNNAGVAFTDDSAWAKPCEVSSSDVEKTMAMIHFGRFYAVKHLLPLMISGPSRGGSVINISSIASHLSAQIGYGIAAMATNKFSQRVAEAYADDGVFCCALHPGVVWHGESTGTYAIRTERLEGFQEWASTDKELTGAFIIWLVKEKRDWLNGRYLDVTWDVEELEAKKDEIVAGDKLKMRLVTICDQPHSTQPVCSEVVFLAADAIERSSCLVANLACMNAWHCSRASHGCGSVNPGTHALGLILPLSHPDESFPYYFGASALLKRPKLRRRVKDWLVESFFQLLSPYTLTASYFEAWSAMTILLVRLYALLGRVGAYMPLGNIKHDRVDASPSLVALEFKTVSFEIRSMSDPFSSIAGAVGIIEATVRAAGKLIDLVGRYNAAPESYEWLKEQLKVVKMLLQQMRNFDLKSHDPALTGFVDYCEVKCDELMNELERKMERHWKPSTGSSSKPHLSPLGKVTIAFQGKGFEKRKKELSNSVQHLSTMLGNQDTAIKIRAQEQKIQQLQHALNELTAETSKQTEMLSQQTKLMKHQARLLSQQINSVTEGILERVDQGKLLENQEQQRSGSWEELNEDPDMLETTRLLIDHTAPDTGRMTPPEDDGLGELRAITSGKSQNSPAKIAIRSASRVSNASNASSKRKREPDDEEEQSTSIGSNASKYSRVEDSQESYKSAKSSQ